MAKESGIFQKNGLDVQIVYFRGGTITTMSLVARETPISQVSGPPMVSAALKGADAVIIAGGNVIAEYWLMSKAEIKTAEQLKISRHALRYRMQRLNIASPADAEDETPSA